MHHSWNLVQLAKFGVLLISAVLWLPACQTGDEPVSRASSKTVETNRSETRTATISKNEVERLRALGYLDYSEERAQAPGEGTMFLDPQLAFPGLTLVIYSGSCSAELVTLEGQTINSWSLKPCRRWDQAVLGLDGSLLVVGSQSDTDQPASEQARSGFLVKLSWSNDILWHRRLPAHHDLEILPNGEMLVLLYDLRVIETIDPTAPVWDNPIGHLDSEGHLLEEISLFDILDAPTSDFSLQIPGRGSNGGESWIDLLHCNELEIVGHNELAFKHGIYSDDHLLITSRAQDAVFVINWRTRELIWHWGPGQLSGPHSGTVIDNGHMLIFDNGLEREWSRVVELDPTSGRIVADFGPPDRSLFFSRVMGANQLLPNGNILITNSAGGQGLELTPAGQPAWVYMGTRRTEDGQRVKIPRMTRIPATTTMAIQSHLANSSSQERSENKQPG